VLSLDAIQVGGTAMTRERMAVSCLLMPIRAIVDHVQRLCNGTVLERDMLIGAVRPDLRIRSWQLRRRSWQWL